MTNFKIAVTSDTVCPWCYIGRRNLQRAISLFRARHPGGEEEDTFSVTFLPFQLNPSFPRGPSGSMPKEQYYLEKFGSADVVAPMRERLAAVGAEAGIRFAFGGRTGNSRDSHRLVWLARQRGGEEAEMKAVDGLFASFFEEEGDITDYENLKKIAAQAGIGADEFERRIVNGDDGGAEVDELAARAVQRGVRGVPDFEIQGKYRMSGARAPEAILEILEKVKASSDAGGADASGQACN